MGNIEKEASLIPIAISNSCWIILLKHNMLSVQLVDNLTAFKYLFYFLFSL